MHYTVYKTTNLVNGKVYIGIHQTDDPLDEYLGSGKNIQRAIAKYGVENFRKEILFDFDNASEMFAKEAELVTEEFCRRDDTYNICPGGQGGWGYINDGSDEHLKRAKKASSKGVSVFVSKLKSNTEFRLIVLDKLSEGNARYIREHPEHRPPSWMGKTHTEESKAKISSSNKGKRLGEKSSQYGTVWITNGLENKKIKNIDSIPIGWYRGRIRPGSIYGDAAPL